MSISLHVYLYDGTRSATVEVPDDCIIGDLLRDAVRTFGFVGAVDEGAVLRSQKTKKLLDPNKAFKEGPAAEDDFGSPSSADDPYKLDLIIGFQEKKGAFPQKDPQFEWQMKSMEPKPIPRSLATFRRSVSMVGESRTPDLIGVFMHEDVLGDVGSLIEAKNGCGLGIFYGEVCYDSNDMLQFVNIRSCVNIHGTAFSAGSCVAPLQSMYRNLLHSDRRQSDQQNNGDQIIGMARVVPGAGVSLADSLLPFYRLWLPWTYNVLILADPLNDEMGIVSLSTGECLSSLLIYKDKLSAAAKKAKGDDL